MELLYMVVEKISECTVRLVARQMGYILNYRSNVEDLNIKVAELGHAKDRVQHSVDTARRRVEEIESGAQDWLPKADELAEEARKFITDLRGRENSRCLKVTCPNLGSRRRMSKKATEMAKSIGDMIQIAASFGDKFSYDLPPQQSALTERTKGYEDFDSRMETLRMIMEALRDPYVRTIGLYGMGGVGKTMLAKEVARLSTQQEKLFSQAILVTVSQTPNYENIQQEIAEKLGLIPFPETSLAGRADRLRQRLRQEKAILIVVDDIWKEIDLHDKVGISFGDDQKECKTLMTSRFKDVLCSDMRVHKNFPVGILSQSESMSLFNKIVGDLAERPAEFQALAAEVVKECGGLPIAINVVAGALKSKSILEVWQSALQGLRMSSPGNIRGMEEKVYSSVQMSYNFLGREEKSLLLLCSLYPEDEEISTDELLRYGVGMGLFKDITNIQQARIKMVLLVENLKSCCLLLDGWRSGVLVRLHDIIRDVAIVIARREKHWHNMRNVAELLQVYMNNENLRDSATALSLLSCRGTIANDQLPGRLESPQLELLLAEGQRMWMADDSMLRIPDLFFNCLDKLKVLGLTAVALDPLPSSFRFLQNVKTLRLSGCRFGHSGGVALIGRVMKNLEILDLSESDVKELGSEMGGLTRLRLLDLKGCTQLNVIQPNVIGSFSRLEELDIWGSFTGWDVEGASNDRDEAGTSRSGVPSCGLSELKNLHQLSCLRISIPDVNALWENVFSEHLEKYRIQLGKSPWPAAPRIFPYSRTELALYNLHMGDRSKTVGNVIGNLFKRSTAVFMRDVKGIDDGTYYSELAEAGLAQCEHLQVARGKAKYILSSRQQAEQMHPCSTITTSTVFPRLEILTIYDAESLEEVCRAKVTASSGSFRRLREVEVGRCPKLKCLLSFCSSSCGIEFPHLRSLTIEYVPELLQFCTHDDSNTSTTTFFNEKVVLPNLERLQLLDLACGKIWDDKFGGGFENLTELKVYRCNNLESVMSSSTRNSLAHLKTPEIIYCAEMKEVIKVGKEEEEGGSLGMDKILFPKLQDIGLGQLPQLKRFCAGGRIECPSLTRLRIKECNEMVAFITKHSVQTGRNEIEERDLVVTQPFFNDKVVLPDLKELKLNDLACGKIWDDKFGGGFKNLTKLKVENCDNSESVMSSSMSNSFVHLEELCVRYCKEMKEVITDVKEEEGGSLGIDNILFPKLRVITLEELPQLKRFCAGRSIECPSLAYIEITECKEMVTFITETALVVKQPFFNDKVMFPELESLHISHNDVISEIWHADQSSSTMPFPRLNSIHLSHLPSLKILIGGFQHVVNVEELCGADPQRHSSKVVPVRSKDLQLCGLSRLLHMCRSSEESTSTARGDHQPCRALEAVGSPSVHDSGNIKTPMPLSSTASSTFLNLQRLRVLYCNALTNLMASSSAANSLQQLKEMEVRGCERVTEIIGNDVDDKTDDHHDSEQTKTTTSSQNVNVIAFEGLEVLLLCDLSSIRRFCAGKMSSLRFPKLERLGVVSCPEMSMFCDSTVHTPRLKTVIVETKIDKPYYDYLDRFDSPESKLRELWEGDVNTTLHKFLEENPLPQQPSSSQYDAQALREYDNAINGELLDGWAQRAEGDGSETN